MPSEDDLWRYFSLDYVTARQRFLDAAEKVDVPVTTHELSVIGPSEERLSIDIVQLGPANPSKLLIHTSGVHGVEGFPGSAVQLRLLEIFAQGELNLPEGCGILIAHAINPHGFAWLRRVNENNADLNRNFLPPDEAYVGEPERYHEIDKFLNPRTHNAPLDLFLLKAIWTIGTMGFNSAKQTIAEGQYERPKAMQYGGSKLYEGPQKWLDHLAEILPTVKRAVWLDFHTGLGPFGVDSLLISGDDSPEKMAQLTSHYGDTVQPNDPNKGVAYRIRGGMMAGVEARWPDIDWTLITQEFGTMKPLQVIKALRAENRMTQWSGLDALKKLHSGERKRLVEVFSPDSKKWRMMIMKRGQSLIDDALSDLAF